MTRSWLGALLLLACAATPAEADVLYAQTNGKPNRVVTIVSGPGGEMALGQSVRTGGRGTGSEIESTGTLAITRGGRFLLVLNMRSSTISVFEIGEQTLTRSDLADSGGKHPVSMAVTPKGRLVVLNRGKLARFKVTPQGQLDPKPGADRAITTKQGAYQVALSPGGGLAALSYSKSPAAKAVELFKLGAGKTKSYGRMAIEGNGAGPISFVNETTVVVGRMGPGEPGVATYRFTGTGLEQVGRLTSGGSPPCWLSVVEGGAWATSETSLSFFNMDLRGEVAGIKTVPLAGETYDVTAGPDHAFVLNESTDGMHVRAFSAKTMDLVSSSPKLVSTTTGLIDLNPFLDL